MQPTFDALQAYNDPKQACNALLQPTLDRLQGYNDQKAAYNEALQPAFDALQAYNGSKQHSNQAGQINSSKLFTVIVYDNEVLQLYNGSSLSSL